MEKIIFFGLAIPILAFVIYLGGGAIMKGLVLKFQIDQVIKKITMKNKHKIFQMKLINLAVKLIN